MVIRWLIYQAWRCYKQGSPLPLDLFGRLIRSGISPEALEEMFDAGHDPRTIVYAITSRVEAVRAFDDDENLWEV